MKKTNAGFDHAQIEQYRGQMAPGRSFVLLETDEANDEYRHFYFVGKADGQEVIYDVVLCTLRLEHESELYELAEQKALAQFPEYQKIKEEMDLNPEGEPTEIEEKIGIFIADTIMEMEEEGELMLAEHVDTDTDTDFGIGLYIGLNVDKITDGLVERVIRDFNNGTLVIDETLVTFQREEEEED